jgi:hypothetical protein
VKFTHGTIIAEIQRYKVKFNDDFVDELSLYLVLGASPSTGKGRSLNWLVQAFFDYEKRHQDAQHEDIAACTVAKRNLEQNRSRIDDKINRLKKEIDKKDLEGKIDQAFMDKEREKLATFEKEQLDNEVALNRVVQETPLCLFTDETTPEGFMVKIQEQKGRLAVLSDDARDAFDRLQEGKYNKASTIVTAWLKSFHGERYTLDRRGENKSIKVERMNTSIMLSVQNDVINRFFSRQESFDSGIVSRFLFANVVKSSKKMKHNSVKIIPSELQWYNDSVIKCLEKSFAIEETVICVFNRQLETVEGKSVQATKILETIVNKFYSDDTIEKKEAWQNRGVNKLGRIAALLSLWENIVEDSGLRENEISARNLGRAHKIMNYFSKEFDVLTECGNKRFNDALEILNFIKREKLEELTHGRIISEFYNKYGKCSLDVLYSRLNLLQERGYVEIVDSGRVKTIYVNPKIYGRDNESVADEPTPASVIPAEISKEFNEYLETRRAKKSPVTEKSIGLLMNILEKLAPGDFEHQRAIINQSIAYGYSCFFKLKEGGASPKSKSKDTAQSASFDLDEYDKISMAKYKK